MRVSRVQAEQNRQSVITAASRLFREHGFDGIGLKDLMKGAGLTQGAFYKQFDSKEDLEAQASRRAFESAAQRWRGAIDAHPGDPLGAVLSHYLSMEHCAQTMDGCPIVALAADAARQGETVKAEFEAGIRASLAAVGDLLSGGRAAPRDTEAMAALSMMVGAMLLSRAVNDHDLSRQILTAAADGVRSLSAADQTDGGPVQ